MILGYNHSWLWCFVLLIAYHRVLLIELLKASSEVVVLLITVITLLQASSASTQSVTIALFFARNITIVDLCHILLILSTSCICSTSSSRIGSRLFNLSIIASSKICSSSSILFFVYAIQWHFLQSGPIFNIWIWVHKLILRVSIWDLRAGFNHILIIGDKIISHLLISIQIQSLVRIEILILIKSNYDILILITLKNYL